MFFYLWGMHCYHSPLFKSSWNSLSRQHFNSETKVKILLKRKAMWLGSLVHLAKHPLPFPPPWASAFWKDQWFPNQKHSRSHQKWRDRDSASAQVCSEFHIWWSRAQQLDPVGHLEDVPQGDENSKASEAPWRTGCYPLLWATLTPPQSPACPFSA